MEAAEFVRWYGPWLPTTPADMARIMAGVSVPWWLVGGWAIEVATGRSREHEDLDISIARSDLPVVLEHLLHTYCVWSVNSGTLRPLRAPDELQEGSRQMWTRRDAQSPWVFDLVLTPTEGDTWVSIRDARIRRPLSEALLTRAGIAYLRPEMVLHMKAGAGRPKDDADFAAALPLLDTTARAWLRETLALTQPTHAWLEQLR